MSREVEHATDVAKARACAVCGEAFGRAQRFMEKNYEHMLSDAAPCQRCSAKIWKLLLYKRWWADDEAYDRYVGENFSARKRHHVPLEKAKGLLALRDMLCERFLGEHAAQAGGVFVVQEVFRMPPSPTIFILRARKVRSRMVAQGFVLKGGVKKGGSVLLRMGDQEKRVSILDVVPKGTKDFERATFFDELSTNLHRHAVGECDEGWIILDTQEEAALKGGDWLACV